MTRGRKLAFGCLVSLMLYGVAEAGLRLLGIGTLAASTDPYLGFFNDVPLFVTRHDDRGREIRVMNRARASKFFPTSFPVDKSENTFRIFCLGGSAAQGWPHERRFTYPRYLEQLLAKAYPSRSFEVVNL